MSPGLPPLRRSRVPALTFRCVLVHVHVLVLALVPAAFSHAQDTAASAPAPSTPALSEPASTPCPGRHILLHAASDVPAGLAREVQTDLATELGRRGLAVCTDGQSTLEPAAIVNLSLREKDAIIELDDRTTQKRVARDVRLDRVPPAGRALALAIAIDELLRASWAELTMREHESAAPVDEEAAPEPTPAPVQAAPRRAKPPPRFRLGGALGALNSRESFHAFSVAVDGELELADVAFLGLALGPLAALPVDGPLGGVSTYGAAATLRAGACLPLGKIVRGCGGAGVGVDYLSFAGDANQAAEAARGGSWLVHAHGLLGLAFELSGRTRLSGDVTLGGALHGVRASDGERTLVGATGLLAGGQLMVQVEL